MAKRRADRLENLKNEIEDDGGDALAVSIEVAGRATIAPAFDLAKAAFGRVTILDNNAGVAVRDHVLDTSAKDWHQIMDVNLDGVFFVAQKATRRMVAAGVGGSIINTASIQNIPQQRIGDPSDLDVLCCYWHLTKPQAL